ncbi:hypothetical protein J6590_055383 [Homalodisca vitripennis]|nr:hypothetical protein J6590_055383 [Homalodisca vitripennis]
MNRQSYLVRPRPAGAQEVFIKTEMNKGARGRRRGRVQILAVFAEESRDSRDGITAVQTLPNPIPTARNQTPTFAQPLIKHSLRSAGEAGLLTMSQFARLKRHLLQLTVNWNSEAMRVAVVPHRTITVMQHCRIAVLSSVCPPGVLVDIYIPPPPVISRSPSPSQPARTIHRLPPAGCRISILVDKPPIALNYRTSH